MGLGLLVDFLGLLLLTVNQFSHLENSFNILFSCAHASDDKSVSFLVF